MKLSEYRALTGKTLAGVANELMRLAKDKDLNITVTDTTVQRWERGENIPHWLWWDIIALWSEENVTISDLREAKKKTYPVM